MFKLPAAIVSILPEIPVTLIDELLQYSDLSETDPPTEFYGTVINKHIEQLEEVAAQEIRDAITELQQAKRGIATKMLEAYNHVQTAVVEAFTANGDTGRIFIRADKCCSETVAAWHAFHTYKSAMIQNLVAQLSATHMITEKLWTEYDDEGDVRCKGIELEYSLI